MSRKKISQLPFSRKFPLHAEAAIYPPQGARVHRATILEGNGYWVLSFEPTKETNIATVKLEDIVLKFLPFSYIFDIDSDGQMEYIEVGKFVVGLKDFDLDATKGTFNMETGEFSMILGISLSPKTVPLLKELGIGPLRFSVTEWGMIDLETDMFKTHAGVFTVPEGPFAGMTVRAGQGPPKEVEVCVTVLRSSIKLWVNCLVPPVDVELIEKSPPENNEITICPGDPILLSWYSSDDVINVKLAPGITGLFPGSGNHPLPGPDVDTVYEATTVRNGYTEEKDTAIVHIFDPSVPIQFTATPDHGSRKWSIEVPPASWSSNIRATKLRIKRPGEPGYGSCFDWPKFFVEHWSPGEATPHIVEASITFTDVPGMFPVAGTWDFWPIDGVPDWDRIKDEMPPLCFAIVGECIRP